MKIKLKPVMAQAVVVFGASSGIGRITALEFAKRGAKVLAVARGEDGLKSLVAEIEAADGEAFYMIADAGDFEQVKAVAERAAELFGRIDTWIHSAGSFILAPVEQTEPDEYKRLIEVNLLGQIYGAKAALPYLKKHGGALIHVTSVESWRTVPYQSAYGASKHGIYGFIQALRSELEHEQIPVSVTQILPAAINTPIYDKGRSKLPYKARPIPPVYHPRIVADAILFAAETPVKDLIAGGAGVGVVLSERFSPRMTDWITSKVAFSWQKSAVKTNGKFDGNLFEPISGFDTAEGRFSSEQFTSDPYTYLQTRPNLKNSLLAGAGILGGFLIWRVLRDKTQTD